LRSAHLELNVQANGDNWGTTGRTVAVHRLTSAWTEAGATWSCADDSNSTNQQADCGSQWNGGAFTVAATASVLHKNGLRGWVSFDVTSDLAAFLGSTANYGWLLEKTDEGQSGRVDYTARTGAAAQAPRLVVTFETPTSQDTEAPSIGGLTPVNGTVTANLTPVVAATYSDSGTGIDTASVRLILDGVDRTSNAQVSGSALSLTPEPLLPVLYGDPFSSVDLPSLRVTMDGVDISSSCVRGPSSATCTPPPLTTGQHTAAASLRDLAGNLAEDTGLFD